MYPADEAHVQALVLRRRAGRQGRAEAAAAGDSRLVWPKLNGDTVFCMTKAAPERRF
jgi:hypothetical protein